MPILRSLTSLVKELCIALHVVWKIGKSALRYYCSAIGNNDFTVEEFQGSKLNIEHFKQENSFIFPSYSKLEKKLAHSSSAKIAREPLQFFLASNLPKSKQIILRISNLASKMGQIQRIKVLWYTN